MKYFLLLPFTLILLCSSFSVNGQSELFSHEFFVDDKDTLLHRQLIPDYNPVRKYPLIIFLHGAGERGNDNKSQLRWGVSQFATEKSMSTHPAIVIAPQCPSDMTWSNNILLGKSIDAVPNASKPMELLGKLIKKAIKDLPVDQDRIYITGLSMGGFGTFEAMQRHPDLFAAAMPICGGGNTFEAATIAHIPIWIFSGAEDSVVSPQLSLDMVNALQAAGGHPGYTQYPEVGHFSWLAPYNDPVVIAWLFRQSKNRN